MAEIAEAVKTIGRDNRVGEASFARGINFYKLFWIFFLTAFIGCAVETVFMYFNWGQIQNRSGLVERFLDAYFPDQRLQEAFSTLKFVGAA